MEFHNPVVEADVNRSAIAERVSRAAAPKPPAATRRHLLAQRLRRFADRVDN
jgi:hypothetical protein